jgi:hypothetical protein
MMASEAEENFIAEAKEMESARHGSKQGVHVVHLLKYLRNTLSRKHRLI